MRRTKHLLPTRLEVRAGGVPAVPPHFAAGSGLLRPMTGANRRVLVGRRPFFPQLGSVVHEELETAFTASGGSLGSSRLRYSSPSALSPYGSRPARRRLAAQRRSVKRMISAPRARSATTAIATVVATTSTTGTIVTSNCDAAAIQLPSRRTSDRLRRPAYHHTPT